MDFNFFLPTRVISGAGCVRKGGAVFSALGRRCLIITGRHSAKLSGALDDCTAALTEQGVTYEVFDGISPNPLLSSCEEAGRRAQAFGADFLIGIGGGSPLDATKAAAFFATGLVHGTELYGKLPDCALPFVLIGTTAGTGSEVTPYSVLTVDETGRKKSFCDHTGHRTFAVCAFADPHYTEALPYGITISTALDALCHAIEGYFSSKATDLSDLFAARAVSLLVDALRAVHKRPNDGDIPYAVRERLLYGSLYAGVTISTTGTGFCHPLGYFLSEEHQIPHGQACAVYLRAFLREAKAHCFEKYAHLFASLGYGGSSVSALIGELLDAPLPHLTDEQLREVAHRCAPTANFATSPGVFTEEKAYTLLKEVFPA
ncbi:iron-containing alcohol dehydrogenase [Ligaoa zhengdingensis]|uniref:iron-containing alcohol dehydrogenase n=2 Tax=Ligaoa zhengdingensis TaxID=2763658 RepID=UPI0031BBC5D0